LTQTHFFVKWNNTKCLARDYSFFERSIKVYPNPSSEGQGRKTPPLGSLSGGQWAYRQVAQSQPLTNELTYEETPKCGSFGNIESLSLQDVRNSKDEVIRHTRGYLEGPSDPAPGRKSGVWKQEVYRSARSFPRTLRGLQDWKSIPPNQIALGEGADVMTFKGKIDELRKLVQRNDFVGDMKAMELLNNLDFLCGHTRWNELHSKGSHGLSMPSFSNINPLARNFIDHVCESGEAKRIRHIMEIGLGVGNTSLFLASSLKNAHIYGLDTSSRAIETLNEQMKRRVDYEELRHRLHPINEDFRNIIDNPEFYGKLDAIHAYSVLHYEMPRVLKWITLPKLARVLRQPDAESGDAGGILCIGLKSVESDAAQSDRHLRLNPGDRDYNSSLHLTELVHRIYPSKAGFMDLIEPCFNVVSCREAKCPDYDKVGETETFLEVILRPKKMEEVYRSIIDYYTEQKFRPDLAA
jgi:hypothetical protein